MGYKLDHWNCVFHPSYEIPWRACCKQLHVASDFQHELRFPHFLEALIFFRFATRQKKTHVFVGDFLDFNWGIGDSDSRNVDRITESCFEPSHSSHGLRLTSLRKILIFLTGYTVVSTKRIFGTTLKWTSREPRCLTQAVKTRNRYSRRFQRIQITNQVSRMSAFMFHVLTGSSYRFLWQQKLCHLLDHCKFYWRLNPEKKLPTSTLWPCDHWPLVNRSLLQKDVDRWGFSQKILISIDEGLEFYLPGKMDLPNLQCWCMMLVDLTCIQQILPHYDLNSKDWIMENISMWHKDLAANSFLVITREKGRKGLRKDASSTGRTKICANLEDTL